MFINKKKEWFWVMFSTIGGNNHIQFLSRLSFFVLKSINSRFKVICSRFPQNSNLGNTYMPTTPKSLKSRTSNWWPSGQNRPAFFYYLDFLLKRAGVASLLKKKVLSMNRNQQKAAFNA